ncbi:MAG: hypothetical protein K2W95_11685 [Candidatus Obscuribacterales bacterium]|nr:hypothetical protein [Candidatus Obscuribacterales bacterium]
MTVDTSANDWTKARRKPVKSSATQDDSRTDKFSGRIVYEQGLLSNVSILRIGAVMNDETAVPRTPAVCLEPDWTPTQRPDLPLNLDWKQAASARFEFSFDLPAAVPCLGLGERFSALDLRGTVHTLLATDNSDHNEAADPLYKSIPFLILYSGNQSIALFLDSAAPQKWDLDSALNERAKISLLTRRGWQLYVFGPAPVPDLVAAYTQLTGRCDQPPRWSLGHFQCRWSYPDDQTVRDLAVEFRSRQIPCDTIVLDIDYMDEYRVFTVSGERFPRFNSMVSDLSAINFRLVTIVDPGVKYDFDYATFTEGSRLDLFCKKADGTLFLDEVWPGVSAFPDFMKQETRSWWSEKLRFYTDQGISGIWNDMNEPAFFGKKVVLDPDALELPEPERQLFMQETESGPVGHLEVRNLYGFEMCRATREGLLKQRPDERPFVLTRSAYAGIQRHAAVWLGDNMSWWEHLRKAVPMLLNVGLSGMAFCGVDIGGFGGHGSAELLVRWYEQGIFYPFFRNHSMMESRAQEPWMFGEDVESKIRHLIETRYKLLPYIETLFFEHRTTGAPLMRPLLWHYPDDTVAARVSDQFLFGRDILVAPVVERATVIRPVYFPEGRWHSIDSDQVFTGPSFHAVKLELGKVPAFVREGAIVPLAEVMQSTAEYRDNGITFYIFGDTADGAFYEDDGSSFACLRGSYNLWQLTWQNGNLHSECRKDGCEGSTRKYRIKHGLTERSVELNTTR